MRKPLSNKQRFEIFRRDSFTCQYCGSSAPDVKLRVDHIQPVAKGGQCEEGNFITSCHACNSGKGADEILPVEISYEQIYPKKPKAPRVDKKQQTINELAFHLDYCLRWMYGGAYGADYYRAIGALERATKASYSFLKDGEEYHA